MKLVGFLKEYDLIPGAASLSELTRQNSVYNIDLNKVINYLNSGELVLGWMGYFMDFETQNLIAPDAYFTDGEWVWPAYFPYYLKKYPHMAIDKTFVEFLERSNYETPKKKNFLQIIATFETQLATILSTKL